jgi:hypothetical protein
LNNRDKHRRLNLLGRQANIAFVDPDGQSLFHGQPASLRIADPNESGAFTARLSVDGPFDDEVLLASTYDVRLHEPPWLVGNLIDTLTEIDRFIEVRVLLTVVGLL